MSPLCQSSVISGEQVFREIDSIESKYFEFDSMRRVDTLLVTSVSPSAFSMLQRKRAARGRKFRYNWYDEDSRRLLVSLNTAAHVRLHLWLYDGVWDALRDMGIRHGWTSIGATIYFHGGLSSGEAPGHSTVVHDSGGGSSGEPESSGGPRPQRCGPGEFPTLVVESGCCRPLSIMQAKARWWFKISNHDVKLVLLAKYDQRQDMITIEEWEEIPREPREGATTTRWGPEGVPSCQQVVTITKTSENPSVYQISGDLVLSFQPLCLREPREGERDVVIHADDLQDYAKMVWGK
ncbi:uncharacterized protein TRIVIDRAFT_65753 [Trichoderma virens Gv29-8]|uniref:Uncharacterized protein n=1 Tax=Hypocrea virens (strain Gv29-8 / FGSC 10586) TaxID=413071 RepID=G9N959_HYPVG|nr:uncharacterized protein TRIVIDRAFT_65753 [Trichoderma virens Gv29-8]EHK16480.1 hypothetical protein TRIVIDRAFT_65753 [Trichoderma virens Gv29-8]UKZ52143.1 hypothetical protein TrVGV298_005918 [Trichoderma virens]